MTWLLDKIKSILNIRTKKPTDLTITLVGGCFPSRTEIAEINQKFDEIFGPIPDNWPSPPPFSTFDINLSGTSYSKKDIDNLIHELETRDK